MVDRYVSLVDDLDSPDRVGGRTPSGMFTRGDSPRHDEVVIPLNDDVVGSGGGKVLPFNRAPRQPESLTKAEISGFIAGFRSLLEQIINFREASEEISLVDENAAEIVLADSDIRIGVRLNHDGGRECWEVWARSEHGSINTRSDVSPDINVRLQFLNLSLSVVPARISSPEVRLAVLTHNYASKEITKSHVQLGDELTVNNLRTSEALVSMRAVYGYILRALPLDIALKQLVG